MANYDAEVRIGTKVDTSQMQRLNIQIDKAVMKVDALSKKYEEVKTKKVPSKEFEDLSICIEGAKFRVEQLEAALNEAKNVKFDNKWQDLLRQEDAYIQRIKNVKEELKKPVVMRESGLYEQLNSYKFALQNIQNAKQALQDGSYWKREETEVANARVELSRLESQMRELEVTGKAFDFIGGDPEKIREAAQNLALGKKELAALVTKQDELIAKQGTTAKKSRSVSEGLKRIGEAGKKAFAKMNSHAKRSGGLLQTMASRLKGILLSLLIFNWITKGFNAMVSGMKKGFKNLVLYSEEYNRSISSLKSANTQLQNSWASAFMPIIQMAIPHIITLINYVTSAANAVAQFTAVLAGKSTWIKAVAVQEDYAASLNGTASAAKKAAGALASFDTLEVLNKNDSSGGSGAGSSNPKDMFEEVPVKESPTTNFAKKIKEAIVDEDWYGLGAILGEKLNEMLEGINWTKIKKKARETGTNIASFLNGGIEKVNWRLVGSTLAEGLNTGFEFLYSFASNFHWDLLGSAIGQSLNGFFNTFDFEKAGLTFSTFAIGLLCLITSALGDTEWETVGASVIEFLAGIQWLELLISLISAGGAIEQAITEFAIGFGSSLIEHLAEGIESAIKDPSKIEELASTYWEWFYHSPFTKMLTMPLVLTYQFAKAIIDGVKIGIEQESASEGIKTAVLNFVMAIADYFGVSAYIVEERLNTFWDEIIAPWFTAEKWYELAQGILDGISTKWDETSEWWSTAISDWWENYVAPWFTVEKWQTLGEAMKKGIYNGFYGIVSKTVDVANAVISAVESMINYMIDKLNKFVKEAVELANSVPGVNISIPDIPNIKFDRVKMPKIPALAEGAVIRGGNPFMAILGDQRAGQTNIEAPAGLIKDMTKAGIAESGIMEALQRGGGQEAQIVLDGEVLGRLTLPHFLNEWKRAGYSLEVLE